MNELAVKSANGTNSESDRSYIQNEIDQLVTEVDRVAQTTKFNEAYLLKGDSSLEKGFSFSYKTDEGILGTANGIAEVQFNKDATTGTEIVVGCIGPAGTVSNATMNELLKSFRDQGLTVTTSGTSTSLYLNGDAASNYKVVTVDMGNTTLPSSGATGDEYNITDLEGNTVATVLVAPGSINSTVTMLADKDSLVAQKSGKELAVFYDKDGNAVSANALSNYFDITQRPTGTGAVNNNQHDKMPVAKAGAQLYDAVGTKLKMDVISDYLALTQDETAALNVKFQVGADTSSSNKISVNIDAMTAKGLGINGLKVDGTDSTNADNAVNTISEAIQKVSKQRSTLGAVQNRLEHTIKNLDNVVENTTSAESAIRDTDMATEMVTYSNANILAQAGQSMLAQANQSNQGVLNLLG
jgi:flagellin